MSLSLSSDAINAAELEKIFKAAPDKFEARMKGFLQEGVLTIEATVKPLTPVNTGALRSSIGHEISGSGAKMQGVVGTAKKYAPFVELDTKPHWPPFKPIEYWVRRKFGLSGNALYLVTRGVQRAIARRGTKGKFMFQTAFEKTEGKIADMWNKTWADAVKEDL